MEELRCVLGERSIYFAAGLNALLRATSRIRIAAHAADPDDLLRQVAQLTPHVVLLGFEPVGESIALTRQIGSFAPVVALASTVREGDDLAAMAAGARALVRKDAPLPDLTRAIQQAAGTHMASLSEVAPRSGPPTPPSQLRSVTRREREILELVVEGRSSKQIARILEIAPQTVKNHLHNMMTRVGAGSRVQLCMWALETGHVEQRRSPALSER